MLDGLNAERILIAAECIGDGYWFIEKAAATPTSAWYSTGPSAKIRASSSPSRAPMPTCEAARPDALRGRASCSTPASLRRRGQHGEAAGGRRVLGSRERLPANVTAASASPTEYDVERKFRETRLYQVAPISTNLILSLSGRACARPAAGRLSDERASPRSGITRRSRVGAGGCRAVLHPPTGGPGRARDQSRAPRRRRFRARLRWRARTACPATSSGSTAGKAASTLDLKLPTRPRRAATPARERADVFVQNLAPGASSGWASARRRCARNTRA